MALRVFLFCVCGGGYDGVRKCVASGSLAQQLARLLCILVGFIKAAAGTGGAAATVAGDAKVAAQVLERARPIARSFTDLAVGDRMADADIHGILHKQE